MGGERDIGREGEAVVIEEGQDDLDGKYSGTRNNVSVTCYSLGEFMTFSPCSISSPSSVFVCMCMCVCVCVYVCAHTHTYASTRRHTHSCTHVHMFYMLICTHTYTQEVSLTGDFFD